MARTSACQSCRMLPFACGILLVGRHFMPVLRAVKGCSAHGLLRAFTLGIHRLALSLSWYLSKPIAVYPYQAKRVPLAITIPDKGIHSREPSLRGRGLHLAGS
jgi:hypothetical protein